MMIKKIYHISGFDCANCAAKAEAHLNKQKNISYARLDFTGNRLYITYKDNPYTLDELKDKIKEVENDPLDIYENESNQNKQKHQIFTKNLMFILIRVIIGFVVTALCTFVFKEDMYKWLRFGLYLGTFIFISYDVIYKVILHFYHRKNILDHNLLIVIAAVGAFVLALLTNLSGEEIYHPNHMGFMVMDEAMEALMVVLLFQIGRIIENVATNKSKSAVMAAVELRIDTANLLTEEGVKKVKPEQLKIDDVIIINVGELIPIDGKVIEGEALIDSSSLTGEFIPIKATKDKDVFAGCLIKQGSIKVKVNKAYADSTVSKIVELISSGGEKKSKADEFIAKFSKIYTPIVVIFSLLVTLIGGFITGQWLNAGGWVYIGLEILVTGCPCAIVISVPLAYFSAVGLASKNGIVVKGANYLDELVRMGKLITDKTGTLTHGSFQITTIHNVDCSKEQLLDYLYAAECLSTHPIGKAICHGKDLKKLAAEQKDFEEIAGLGVKTTYLHHQIVAGSKKMMANYDHIVEEALEIGTAVYVLVDNQYKGYVILSDELKEDAQPMVDLLHHENVEIILLTGDHEENAKDICDKLGIDRFHSQLLPEQKTDCLIEEMNNTNKAVAFIGDGINDAPSIIRSDIGIAMGGIGSDIAVENADIVIMNDDPAKVYDARKIAKMARNTSMFNIFFALGTKFIVMALAILQEFIPSFSLPMVIPVLADTGLTVLLVINSLLLLYRKVIRPKHIH